jgi:hypothetical protein
MAAWAQLLCSAVTEVDVSAKGFVSAWVLQEFWCANDRGWEEVG